MTGGFAVINRLVMRDVDNISTTEDIPGGSAFLLRPAFLPMTNLVSTPFRSYRANGRFIRDTGMMPRQIYFRD